MNLEEIKASVSTNMISPNQGSNFQTHVLKHKPHGIIQFRASDGLILLCTAISFAAVLCSYYNINKYIKEEYFDFSYDSILWFIVNIFLCIASIYFIYLASTPIEFNKKTNSFHKGYRKSPFHTSVEHCSLDKIVAIQLLGEVVTDDDSNFHSFELNLVLNSSNRINVIDHNNLKTIINDARYLSNFLNVSIWTIIDKS